MINGDLLRKLREEKNLTQAELGARVGAEGNLVSRWERGKATPSQKYLVNLSTVFDKPIDFLLKMNGFYFLRYNPTTVSTWNVIGNISTG